MFRERETERLLNPDADLGYRIRKDYLTRFKWKSLFLAACCGIIIAVILWFAIRHYEDSNPQPQILLSSLPNLPEDKPQITWEFVPKPKLMKSPFTTATRNKNATTKSLERRKKPHPPKPEENIEHSPTISIIGNTTFYTYHFVTTEGLICPDNYAQKGFLINGQTPGPEIRISQHSILILHVENRMSTPVTFHLHGIHQRKSFLSDGVPGVTQNPILPGSSFTYTLDTWPQVGTFFYHAHTAMDIVWLFGPIIIQDDPKVYDKLPPEYKTDGGDRVLILNGVYHEPLDGLVEKIAGPVHSYPVGISSITTNGKSHGVWDGKEAKAKGCENHEGFYITNVTQGMKYRFRFINAASDSLLSCRVDNHTLWIIETDGIYVFPVESDHLVLSPGQRYSVTILMDQPPWNYWIRCVHMESAGPLNGLSILHYEGAEEPPLDKMTMAKAKDPEKGQGTANLPIDPWIVDQLGPNFQLKQTDLYELPLKVDQEFIVDVYEAVEGQKHVYLINGHYFEEPDVPYFLQLQNSTNITKSNQVYEILEGQAIQFIFQNQRSSSFCFSHPWHIHGHSFHVVGSGPDRYNPAKDGARIQAQIELGQQRFQFRDSVTVYANQTEGEEVDGAYCGWTAVRFAAHNPGLWLAHCHVTPHMIMGKKFIIWEHTKEDPFLKDLTLPPIPDEIKL